jgi:hypothetical protein
VPLPSAPTRGAFRVKQRNTGAACRHATTTCLVFDLKPSA